MSTRRARFVSLVWPRWSRNVSSAVGSARNVMGSKAAQKVFQTNTVTRQTCAIRCGAHRSRILRSLRGQWEGASTDDGGGKSHLWGRQAVSNLLGKELGTEPGVNRIGTEVG